VSIGADKPIRVLIFDHQGLIRDGIRMILNESANIQVVGEAGGCEQALGLAKGFDVDIILIELNLDGELNTDIISELIKVNQKARIILLTSIEESQILHLAVQMGAMGVVSKTGNRQTLYKAIEKVYAGEVWIDRAMMADVLTQISRSRLDDQGNPEIARMASLSDREREVIELIGKGLKNKEIATQLSISEITVRHHLSSIYSKLDVANRLELTIYAYRNGLADLPM
jgi:two-component system, NarL family, nitrate/nitrite response regulator NarL